MADLVGATWLVTSASIAAREAFDTFFAQASASVRTYGVVTHSATMLRSLLLQGRLLAFIPVSVVRGELDAGLLTELAWSVRFPSTEIGILAPQHNQGSALVRFARYMEQHARVHSQATCRPDP